MKNIKKGKVVTAVTVCFAVLLAIGIFVSAYFTDQGNKDNTVTVGHNTHEISEEYIPPKGQETGENTYIKKITIANTGNTECYIRVYVDFSDSDIRSRSELSNDDQHFYSADRSLSGNTYVNNLSTAAPKWEFKPDDDSNKNLAGYYYYKVPVAAGESTEPLFTYVRTKNETVEQIQQYDIIVYSESYQTTDSSGKKYDSYEDAWNDFSPANS